MYPELQYVLLVFGLSLLVLFLLSKAAFKVKLLDRPCERKQHASLTPLVGGIALLFVVLLTFVLPIDDFFDMPALFGGMLLLLVVGVIDDYHGVPPKWRLCAQVLAALVAMTDNHVLVLRLAGWLNFSAWGELGQILAVLFTVIFLVMMINATNMLDGQDGLLGSVLLTQCIWFAVLYYKVSLHHEFLYLLIGFLLAFLCFNFPRGKSFRASLFMGDAGSTALGFVMGWSALYLVHASVPFVVVLWVLFVPILDIVTIITRRLLQRRSPFLPDRAHLHHLLQDQGLSVLASTTLLALISLLTGAIGVFAYAWQLGNLWSLLLFVCFFSACFFSALFLPKWHRRACKEL